MADDVLRRVQVASQQQALLERARLGSQGYALVCEDQREGRTVIVMWRKKRFNGLAFGLGLMVWLLPGVIYLLVYLARGDDVVEVVVEEVATTVPPDNARMMSAHVTAAASVAPPSLPPTVLLSPDRQQWWDGSEWRDLGDSIPPEVDRSPDARSWWDGREWRPVPSLPA